MFREKSDQRRASAGMVVIGFSRITITDEEICQMNLDDR